MRISIAPIFEIFRLRRSQGDSSRIVAELGFVFAFHVKGIGTLGKVARVLAVDSDRLIEIGDRRIVLSPLYFNIGPLGVGAAVIWVDADGFVKVGDRFIKLLLIDLGIA